MKTRPLAFALLLSLAPAAALPPRVAFAQAADRFGRKTVFTASLLWYVASTVIMAFQRTGEGLNIWRFIAGVGFGVQLVTIDTYLVELVPAGPVYAEGDPASCFFVLLDGTVVSLPRMTEKFGDESAVPSS